jgi:hypothetical protein
MPNHERLIPSLGDYDLVGFQTHGDAANFARYLAKELGTPSHISLRLGNGDRAMRIGTFPVGIETREFTRLARRAVKTDFRPPRHRFGPGLLDDRRGPAGLFEGHHAQRSKPMSGSWRPTRNGTARSPICRSRPKAAVPSRNIRRWKRR